MRGGSDADAMALRRAPGWDYRSGTYQAWLDNLPDGLQDSALAQKLQTICELDLADLEAVEPPLGFGRD